MQRITVFLRASTYDIEKYFFYHTLVNGKKLRFVFYLHYHNYHIYKVYVLLIKKTTRKIEEYYFTKASSTS